MSKTPGNFEDALKAFEDVEHDLELAEWTINGVYVWKILRFSIFSAYRQHFGLMGAVHPEMQRLRKSKVRMVCEFPMAFLFRNPFFMAGGSTERVIIPSPRKREYSGRLVDPISYPAWCPPYDKKAVVLDRTNALNQPLLPGAPSFEVLARLAWLRGRVVRVRLGSKDHHLIAEIWQKLFGETDAALLEHQVRRAVKAFVGLRIVFTRFLEQTRANYLYVVCSYGCEAPIAAARDMGIQTVEFHHGGIGRGHLGYDFKSWSSVPYFPDRILALGLEWFRGVYFPRSCTIDPVGCLPLDHAIAESNRKIARRPRQLLALSQGPIAEQILKHVARFCAKRPEWEVVIRPHPNENVDHLRQQMGAITTTGNWRVEKKPSLQAHTAASSVVFGSYSTAVVEALLAGCRIALLDEQNSPKVFDNLVKEGQAEYVQDGEELAQIVNDIPDGNARGYFSVPIRDIVGHVEGPAPNPHGVAF